MLDEAKLRRLDLRRREHERQVGRDARLVMGGMVDWLERSYPVEKQPVRA